MSGGARPVRSAIVAVGEELLSGQTVDTNAAWLGRRLDELGAPVRVRYAVGDDDEAIREAVRLALRRAEIVVVTGGLGPTPDDRTKAAVAELLGRPLETDEELLARLERAFREMGYPELPPTNRSQAEVPQGAWTVPNPHGTAPGLVLEAEGGRVALLPGVPREMKGLFEGGVAEILARGFRERLRPTFHRVIRTTGIAESALADEVRELLPDESEPVSVAFLPRVTGVDLRLTATSVDDRDEAEHRLDEVERRLAPALARYRYESERGDLVDAVAEALLSSRRTLATAESCTGGLVAKRLTDRPGSSDYFQGGVVSYGNASKVRDLGVAEEALERHGAVSEPVVRAMSEGAIDRFGTPCALAITGIAGPGGGTDEKPVGTVWYAVTVEGRTRARRARLPGDRSDVRERSAQAALHLLLRTLEDDE